MSVMLFALGPVIGEFITIALIAAVIYLIWKIGGGLLKILFGIIANSILGLISILVLNYFLNIGIPLTTYTLLATALFGLPAVGTFMILRFFGISLLSLPVLALLL